MKNPLRNLSRLLAAGLLSFTVTACGDAADLTPSETATGSVTATEAAAAALPVAGIGAVAVEDFNGTEIAAARTALPTLAAKGVAVVLHWKANDLANAERWSFVQEARSRGVEVRPWLLLDEADGYWPCSSNASLFASKARQLASLWTDTYHLPPTTFFVDMELRIDRFRQLNQMLAQPIPDVLGIAWLLGSGVNRWQYFWATQTYAGLVNDLHRKGWKVHLTTLPQVADDYSDGDDGIRQAMGIPVDGIAWDEVSIQAYRTIFARQTGGLPLTPFFVYDYGNMAKRVWGAKASLDIGITGTGVDDSPTYANAGELKKDVEAAIAAGYTGQKIGVYNLQGMIDRPPVDSWLQTPNPAPPAPGLDLGTPFIHSISIALDLLF